MLRSSPGLRRQSSRPPSTAPPDRPSREPPKRCRLHSLHSAVPVRLQPAGSIQGRSEHPWSFRFGDPIYIRIAWMNRCGELTELEIAMWMNTWIGLKWLRVSLLWGCLGLYIRVMLTIERLAIYTQHAGKTQALGTHNSTLLESLRPTAGQIGRGGRERVGASRGVHTLPAGEGSVRRRAATSHLLAAARSKRRSLKACIPAATLAMSRRALRAMMFHTGPTAWSRLHR